MINQLSTDVRAARTHRNIALAMTLFSLFTVV